MLSNTTLHYLDGSLHDQETVRTIQYCYLYALYIQMLNTRTQAQAKELFLNLLQVGWRQRIALTSLRDVPFLFFEQILAYVPLLNELQEKKVGSLVPPSKWHGSKNERKERKVPSLIQGTCMHLHAFACT